MNLTKHWAAALDDYAIDLSWSPDGAFLAAASAAGPISVFRAADGAACPSLAGHDPGTNCLAFSPSKLQPILASGGQDGAVKYWDVAAGQHIATAQIGGWVDHLAWRPAAEAAGRGTALCAASGRKLLFTKADAGIVHTAEVPKTITALAWEPGGGCIAAACFGSIRLFDAADFLVQKELAYANGIHALVWSPDGRWLVSGNQDPSVHLWIPEEEIELHMSGYETKVRHLGFDRTSRWLATGGGKDACVWDCRGAGPEGREPAMLAHESPVCAVAFQGAHSLLATGAQDGTVMLWSPERKDPLRATVRMPAPATKLVWSPDDRFLAIGSAQGAVYVLRCES